MLENKQRTLYDSVDEGALKHKRFQDIHQMTVFQTDLFSKIQSLKNMFSGSGCANMSLEADSLIRDMIAKLVDTMHNTAIIPLESVESGALLCILKRKE